MDAHFDYAFVYVGRVKVMPFEFRQQEMCLAFKSGRAEDIRHFQVC